MPYVLLLILIEVILFFTNYVTGTYLIGWDNIMPEFNLLLNFKRALFSTWQEYRGLGLLDGMAHAANLFHTLYISLLSLFLPLSMLRFTFIFLTHLIGAIAFFYLAFFLTKNKKASFLAAAFYMLNLGIIQMYYAPLEVFAVHFAALPILTLLIIKALKLPNKKNLLLLFIGSVLTTPQGFIPTVFFAFFVLFLSQIIVHFFTTKKVKSIALTSIIILAANAFWLLPFGYSAVKNANIIQNTKINQFSSEEIFYRNQAYGDIASVLSLKGFMIDTVEFDQSKNKNVYFMEAWRNHQGNIIYKFIYFVILIITFIGLFDTVKKRKTYYLPFVFALFISFLFLANNTPIINQLNIFFRNLIPVFGEVFRFSFTKFITLFVFCLSLFFANGLSIIRNFSAVIARSLRRSNPIQSKRLLRYARNDRNIKLVLEMSFLTVTALGIFYLSFPAFQGYFFSPFLKLNLPKDYLDTFKYLDKQNDSQRIALLPSLTFWNWQYYDWGQRGSGFLWYGIQQPILERAFDPWSNLNEQFYNELSYAINTQNTLSFENVLRKYDIKYLLLDKTILNSVFAKPINYVQLESFLTKSTFLRKKKEFGKLIVYETNLQNSFIYTLNGQAIKTYPGFSNEKEDNINLYAQNYIFDNNKPDLVYIFPSLFTEKLQSDLEFTAIENADSITLIPKKTFPFKIKNYLLEIPSFFSNEFLIPVKVSMEEASFILTPSYPTIYINGKKISIYDEPIVIKPQIITKPNSIKFSDLNYEVPASQNNIKTYLLNKYVNTIKLKDDANEENVFVDTQNVKQPSFLIPIKEDQIKTIKIVIDKIKSPPALVSVIKKGKFEVQTLNSQINPFSDYFFSKNVVSKATVTLESRSSSAELTFNKNNLFHQASYILFVKTKYLSGLPMNFYVDNPFETKSEVETRLSKTSEKNVIVIPKTQNYFQGYGFHFIVKSVGIETAKSEVEDVSLFPFPAETLKQIRLVSPNFSALKNFSAKTAVDFTKLNPSLYVAVMKNGTIEQSNNSTIILSQSFDSGWHTYTIANSKLQIVNSINTLFPFIFGTELKDHVLVNNWANGWSLSNYELKTKNYKLVIVYLPQYLEYFGFILLIFTLTQVLHFRHCERNEVKRGNLYR
ncbi:MAG: hypothetical protein HYT83_02970 [Candidatus Levybacteria bacterium]|nr:hypothetical protein [Candidatus Levybacteria bacterium]